MDPRFCRFSDSVNGIQLGNQAAMSVFPDRKLADHHVPRFENIFPVHNPVDHEPSIVYDTSVLDHNFGGIQFLPNDPSPSATVLSSSGSAEDELHEDCDLSDAILGYISQMLMEEDMEDQTCMLQESLDLHAAEKSFYEVLGKKYPPPPEEGGTSVDHYRESPDDYPSLNYKSSNVNSGRSINGSGYLIDQSWMNGHSNHNASCPSISESNSISNVADGFLDSPVSAPEVPDIYNGSEMLWQFRKGVEEANKFLSSGSRLMVSFHGNGVSKNQDFKGENISEVAVKVERKDEGKIAEIGSRVRKVPHGEDAYDEEVRSSKQAAVYPDTPSRTEEFDLVLLCGMTEGQTALSLLRNTLQNETSKIVQKNREQKGVGKGKGRGKKQNKKKEVIDLRTLLISCAQAVAADDRRNASELLKQIRQHASPFGDGNQRLAHCFADGLEARLAGTGSQIHKALVSKKTSAADYLKAYHLYLASCPFRKISNFASNRTIRDSSENAMRLHIIDFGILYGFQWPTFIQRISDRDGGPPRLRITGIEFPQPGFRPAQRIEETGRRLAYYAQRFKVPFEYNAIAKKWENVKVEDLKIDKDEFVVVNCLYRSKNLLDETVVVDSARNIVLNLIRKINPDLFIHGIVNGSYNAPFFVTRFREALFHFSALFDMLETNVSRERSERMLIERDLFGREALNVIACEGWERVERPETYKQWHVRNLRAGFLQIPLSRWLRNKAKEKVKLYHKDFVIDEDGHWLLQGWKGRIIYAISCWKPA